MGIALTDDHRELADVARSFLAARKARSASRELLDTGDETRPQFWADLAELGWLGLHIEEDRGGSGFGLPELVVVVEELGRAIAPGPLSPPWWRRPSSTAPAPTSRSLGCSPV